MRQAGEPSVEEILESIKKVIARDNRETAQAERRRRQHDNVPVSSPAPSTASDLHSPMLEELEQEQCPIDDAEEVLELEDIAADPNAAPEGLTNEDAAAAMRQSLAALAMLAQPGNPPQIVRSGETSLEGLVRELLRPMLATWLDTHLPEIVESQVKAEIARIAGKKH